MSSTSVAKQQDDIVPSIRDNLLANSLNRGPFIPSGLKGGIVTEERVPVPADPALTDREVLSLHAEILALQQQLGLSYKDATHRLYLAELSKLRVQNTTCKSLAYLSDAITLAIGDSASHPRE